MKFAAGVVTGAGLVLVTLMCLIQEANRQQYMLEQQRQVREDTRRMRG